MECQHALRQVGGQKFGFVLQLLENLIRTNPTVVRSICKLAKHCSRVFYRH